MIACPVASKAELETTEDVNAALHELAWLNQKHQELTSRCSAEVQRLQQQHQPLFVLDSGETIVARRATVEAALVTWCDAHLDEHLQGDKKSLDLPHGTVGRADLPAAIEYAEGMDEKKVIGKLKAGASLVTKLIADLLKKLTLGLALSDLVRIKVELSKSGAMKAFKEARIKRAQLKSIGLIVADDRSRLVIEPKALEVDANAPS